MDQIEIRGLRVVGIVGALDEERVRAQPFEVDVDIHTDVSEAGATDDQASLSRITSPARRHNRKALFCDLWMQCNSSANQDVHNAAMSKGMSTSRNRT